MLSLKNLILTSASLLVLTLFVISVISPIITLASSYGANSGVLPRPEPTPSEPVKPSPPVSKNKGVIKGKKLSSKDIKSKIEEALRKLGISSSTNARLVVVKGRYAKAEFKSAEFKDLKTNVMRVKLITGDEVTLIRSKGKVSVIVKPSEYSRAGAYYIIPAGNSVYVIPNNADLKKFDISLFNIKLLYEYKRLGIKYLPVIVKVKELSPKALIGALTKEVGLKASAITYLRIINAYSLRIPENKLGSVYRELESNEYVVKVVPDRIVKALRYEDISSINVYTPKIYQSVPEIGAPTLWSLGINGSGIRIAILDTGIDPHHPDFYVGNKSKIIANASFVDWNGDGIPDESPIDMFGHGTHCAGIAAGTGGYLSILKGVAPGSYLLVGKVLSNLGFGFDTWIIEGIEWAINNSADIISMSLGGPAIVSYDPLVDAVNKAVEEGVVVVIAAGNEGPGYFTVSSPGVAEGAITVAAIDKLLRPASFTSWGPTPNATLKPDVAAPGVHIASARANGTYMGEPASLYHVYASGTSMATPHVAGLAALVLQYLRTSGLLEEVESLLGGNVPVSLIVKDVIVGTTSDLDPYEAFIVGAGVVNATKMTLLINNSELIVMHPARADLVSFEHTVKTLTIKVVNPYSKALNLSVEPKLVLWSGITTEPELLNLSDAVIVSPSEITLGANSVTEINVTVDFSKLPSGYHALKIYLRDSNGTIVSKALIGISKPVVAMVNVYPETSYVSVTAIGYSPVFGEVSLQGYDWGWVQTAGVLYPLYPDMVYLVMVTADFSNETTYMGGIYFKLLSTTNLTKNIYTININFTELKPVNVTIGKDLDGIAVSGYSAYLALINSTSNEVVAAILNADLLLYFLSSYYRWTSALLYMGVDGSIINAWNYTVLVSPYYFSIKSVSQPVGIYPNSTYPYAVFYREFDDAPRGSTIELVARNLTQRVLVAHGALSNTTLLTDCSALLLYSEKSYLDADICSVALVPSLTTYLIDSNVGLPYGLAYDAVSLIYNESWVSIEGYDTYGHEVDNITTLYAPLTMPKASTMWAYSSISRGLDGYNFTYGLAIGQMFRETIFKYYYVYASDPIFKWYMRVGNVTVEALSTDAFSPTYLEAFAANTPTNITSVIIGSEVNFTLIPVGRLMSFHKMASMTVNMSFIKPNYSIYTYLYGFGYGLGVRDIEPLVGYDYLRNYIPAGATAYYLMLFNTPATSSSFDLNLSTVSVTLIGPKGTKHKAPILEWVDVGPLHGAIVAVNTTEVLMSDKPGPYTLLISGEYYDTSGSVNGSITFTIRVSHALYIGMPPYTLPLPMPTVVTVGPEGSGANYTSISEAVKEVAPGSTIIVLPGTYKEELIVIDKPLTIVGQLNEYGELPTIVSPHGYPIFIVLSPANISLLELEPYSEASVPKNLQIPLPTDALIPPAAIIAYNTIILTHNLVINGYPRGITAYESAIQALNITIYVDPYYLVNSRRAEALRPTPIYVYRAPAVNIVGLLANEVPIIRKTYWGSIGLSDIVVNNMSVDIIKNETVNISMNKSDLTPVIILGENVSVKGSMMGTLEIISMMTSLSGFKGGDLLISTTSSYLQGVSAGPAMLDSAITTINASSLTGSLIISNVKDLLIASSSVDASGSSIALLINTLGSSNVTIMNSSIGNAELASIYVVLHDADTLVFRNNYVHDSFYGLVILESYSEVAPDVLIESNTFVNVRIPIYIAPAIAPSAQPPTTPEIEGLLGPLTHPKTSFSPKLTITDIFSTSRAFISRIYLRYNNVSLADIGVWIGGGLVAPILLGNTINAESTGVVIEGSYYGFLFYNDIKARTAILVNSSSFIIVNQNNLSGNVTVLNTDLADLRYNYVSGYLSNSSSNVYTQPLYREKVVMPPITNPVVPWLNITVSKAIVGEEFYSPLILINPNPKEVVFDYRVRVSGSALKIEGEESLSNIKLGVYSTPTFTAIPDITLKVTTSGRASLLIDLYVEGTTYTVSLPVIISAPKVSLEVLVPQSVIRGEEFNATIRVNTSVASNYSLIISVSSGLGICIDNCRYYTFAYIITKKLSEGLNEFNVSIIALRTGKQSITVATALGYTTYRNSTSLMVEPNSYANFSLSIIDYPENITKGMWGSITVNITNLVSIPTWINITSRSNNSAVVSTRYSSILYLHTNGSILVSIPIYAVNTGKALIRISAIDEDDNVSREASLVIYVNPVPVYNYSVIGYGVVSTERPNATASQTYPERTLWADLLMYIYASQAGISLEKLKLLIEVPWGCVEQTTSPLLAGIEVYRYLAIQDLWSKAADAMGMSVDQLKDLLVNKTIRKGVKRLLEYHAKHCVSANSCVLSWYPGMGYDFFYTAYGLTGLIKAYEFQVEYLIQVYSNGTRLNETIEKLVRGLAEHQGDDGSWEEDVVSTSMALNAIARALRLGFKAYGSPTLSNESIINAIGWLLSKQLSDGSWGEDARKTAYALQALAQAKDSGFNIDESRLISAVLWLNSSKYVSKGLYYWTSGGWWVSSYEVTARVVLALVKAREVISNATIANLAYELAKKGAKYLASKAYEWIRWGNTYAGAQILRAINSLGEPIIFITTQPATLILNVKAGNTVVLTVNLTIQGETWWGCYIDNILDVTSESIEYCKGITYAYLGNWLSISRNITLNFNLTGNATAYWFADTIYEYYPLGSSSSSSSGTYIPKERFAYLGKGKVIVKQVVSDGNNNGNSGNEVFEIEKIVEPSIIKPGDIVNVTIRVRSLNGTIDYVVVADKLPSGFTLMNYYLPDGVSFDETYYNETGNPGFAIESLGNEWLEIKYSMRAPSNVALGTTITLPPASIRMFYEPENVDTNTTSNTPTITIGIISHLSIKGVMFSEYASGVGNETLIKWGEVLNISIITPTTLSRPKLIIEVYNESNILIYSKEVNSTKALLDTADLKYSALVNGRASIKIKLYEEDTELAHYSISVSFPSISLKDVSERAKAVVRLWAKYINNPEILKLVSDLAKGTVRLWALAVTS